MIPQWIIEKKRDGKILTNEEIDFFIKEYSGGNIPDYQASALAMAIFFQGMTDDETAAFTRAMWRSGTSIDTSVIKGVKIDKHSTGGVGDKISLILAPLAASAGLIVPMIAGRGLGITGGTLDKLESIPGYRIDLNKNQFIETLKACGCSIIGQTPEIAPADKKLYALRDVTGTVQSIPLIVSSILSKKLAAGIEGLILDIKWGSGAFMKTKEAAKQLARALSETGRRMNLKIRSLITDMNQPLGRNCGNALEVEEAIETLKGYGSPDVVELTLSLCALMLEMGGIEPDIASAFKLAEKKLNNGDAFERFKHMVKKHGGDEQAIENPKQLHGNEFFEIFSAPRKAYIKSVNAEIIGKACLILGAGRSKTDEKIDHIAGISKLKKVGALVKAGESAAIAHSLSREKLTAALPVLESAFEWSDQPVNASPLIDEDIIALK